MADDKMPPNLPPEFSAYPPPPESPLENFPGRNITPIFANQFYVVVADQTTRLTLGEIVFVAAPANFSSAVVMPTSVAIDLAQNILRIAREQGYLNDGNKEPDVLG